MKKGVCPICGKKVYKVIMYNGKVVGCKYCGINSPWTNADRIRAMTDEELAEWMAYDVIGPSDNKSFEDTKALCLEWLKTEVGYK